MDNQELKKNDKTKKWDVISDFIWMLTEPLGDLILGFLKFLFTIMGITYLCLVFYLPANVRIYLTILAIKLLPLFLLLILLTIIMLVILHFILSLITFFLCKISECKYGLFLIIGFSIVFVVTMVAFNFIL